jgi:hypothetical protein
MCEDMERFEEDSREWLAEQLHERAKLNHGNWEYGPDDDDDEDDDNWAQNLADDGEDNDDDVSN